MAEKCETCEGHGKIGVLVPVNASVNSPLWELQMRKCPTCHGTGKKVEPDETK